MTVDAGAVVGDTVDDVAGEDAEEQATVTIAKVDTRAIPVQNCVIFLRFIFIIIAFLPFSCIKYSTPI